MIKTMAEETTRLTLFPLGLDKLRSKYKLPQIRLRGFGQLPEDLNIDFDQENRPLLVTQIIRQCIITETDLPGIDDFLWEMAISKRIECLLKIFFLSQSGDINVSLVCSQDNCQKKMEIELTKYDLFSNNTNQELETIEIKFAKHCLYLRRPSGNDQLTWWQKDCDSDIAAIQTIILQLTDKNILPGELNFKNWLNPKKIQEIDRLMETFDPLLAFSLRIICPYCQAENSQSLNLEAIVLAKLQAIQTKLINDINCLARHYHWSEEEILAVPAWRRDKYLKLID